MSDEPTPPAVDEPAAKRPDALLIPKAWAANCGREDPVDLICTYAESILGGDRQAGVTARLVDVNPKEWFATLNYNNTLFHECGHVREKRNRYTWTDREDGAKSGVLTNDATPAEPMQHELAASAPSNPIAKMAADNKLKRKEAARAR